MIGVGIGLPFFKSFGGIDAQAQAHFDRVIADGGLVPSGLSGVNAFFTTIKTIYGTSDITTAISVGLDAQVLGYKLGAGAGTTAGQAAQKLYSCSGASGDVVQTTAASQPLLLVHSGANYWFGSGVSGNFVSTPNAAANQITGDIEIVAQVNYRNNGAFQFMVNKFDTAGYGFAINASDFIYSEFRTGGISYGVTTNASITNSFNGWIKTSRTTAGVVIVSTSLDGVNYTQLGASLSTPSGALQSGSAVVKIGEAFNTNFPFRGRINRATISNTIGGAPVVDFNPNQYNAANSQTQWTSSTGEVWTINTGTATTGYKGVLVDRTEVQGDGIDDRLTSGTLPTRQYFTRFAALNYLVGQAPEYIIAGNPVETHLIYFNTPFLRLYNTASEINVSGAIANNLQLITGDYNGASSKVRRNNAADVTGTTGAATSTIINLFSSGSGTLPSNAIINTEIDAVAVSNDTQKTAMYNYIRSINNNAF
jgi:hypothetical protein